MKHKIYVSRVQLKLGAPLAYRTVKKAAQAALGAEGVNETAEIAVLLTDDSGIRRINFEFRNVDEPTDVLSFPHNELTAGAFSPEACDRDPGSGRLLLGDMAISIDRVKMQAKEYSHSFEHELAYLVVHSVLHLLGYDHMDEDEQKWHMREREKAIMAELGI